LPISTETTSIENENSIRDSLITAAKQMMVKAETPVSTLPQETASTSVCESEVVGKRLRSLLANI